MAKQTLTVQLMHATARIAELDARNADLVAQLEHASSLSVSTPKLPSPARIAYLAACQQRADHGAGMPTEFQIRCDIARQRAMSTGKAVLA